MQEIVNNLSSELDYFKSKTLMITGHAGFLGNLLTTFFAYLNSNVFKSNEKLRLILVDSFLIGETPHIDKNCYDLLINQDICSNLDEKLDNYDNIHIVYNCAGVANPKIYRRYPTLTWMGATVGSQNILSLCRQKNVENILMFSSSESYGHIPDSEIPVKESYAGNLSTRDSRSCYSESKRMLETICEIHFKKYNLPIKVIKPFNVYGIPMSINDGRVMPSFIRSIIKGEKLKVYGAGSERRTFCYSSDFLTGLLKITLHGQSGEHYNIGAESPELSILELAQQICDIIKVNKGQWIDLIPPIDGYESQTLRRCPSLLKLRGLEYKPQVTLEDGISRYYSWAKSQP